MMAAMMMITLVVDIDITTLAVAKVIMITE